eukprot:1192074-Prorocentrum_minimum.AAC.6
MLQARADLAGARADLTGARADLTGVVPTYVSGAKSVAKSEPWAGVDLDLDLMWMWDVDLDVRADVDVQGSTRRGDLSCLGSAYNMLTQEEFETQEKTKVFTGKRYFKFTKLADIVGMASYRQVRACRKSTGVPGTPVVYHNGDDPGQPVFRNGGLPTGPAGPPPPAGPTGV